MFRPPQKYLGPSQVCTVLGYNNFQTTEELQDRIQHGYTVTPNPSLDFGQKYERAGIQAYIRATGHTVKRAGFAVDPQCGHFGGICDGLINDDPEGPGGIEVKCTKGDPVVYVSHKIQAVCYMYLYRRAWWDIAVCQINVHPDTDDATGGIQSVRLAIKRIYWEDYKDTWEKKWYPKIRDFIRETWRGSN